MSVAEIRVTRRGAKVTRVEWNPCRDGESPVDLTGMKITDVRTTIRPETAPYVEVTFFARLVEIEEPYSPPPPPSDFTSDTR